MHTVLKDFSASSVVDAMEINAHEAWIRFAHGLGAAVYDEPHMLWFFSGLPVHLANGIVNARFPEDCLEEILGERLRQLAVKQVPMAWLIGPSTRPVDLGSHLQAHGWMLGDEAPGMAIELQTLDEAFSSPPSLTIERISNAETLRTWLRVMTVGSDIPEEGLTLLLELVSKHGFTDDPSVHYYLGLLADKPVATSLLYLGGGVAGIYNVATLPEVRRQGIGSALTVAPLLQARTWGYRIGTLQSTPMGLHLYRGVTCLPIWLYKPGHSVRVAPLPAAFLAFLPYSRKLEDQVVSLRAYGLGRTLIGPTLAPPPCACVLTCTRA